MKRYWTLAVLIPLIVLSIGTYYTMAETGRNPGFVLKTLSGDEQEAAGVGLLANSRGNEIFVDQNGSSLEYTGIIWNSVRGSWAPNQIMKQHVREHRQFMRGKTNLMGLYQDEQTLGYAEIKRDSSPNRGDFNFRFQISAYDKASKKTVTGEIPIPNQEELRYIHIQDVQINGQNMSLVIYSLSGADAAKDPKPDYHLYKVDLTAMKIVSDAVILSEPEASADMRASISAVSSMNPTVKERYVVFNVRYSKPSPSEDVFDHRELLVYNLETGQITPIESPQLQPFLTFRDPKGYLDILVHGEELHFFSTLEGKKVQVASYHLGDKTVNKNFTLSLQDIQTDKEKVLFSRFENNRLYMVFTPVDDSTGPAALVIAELDQGRIVYTGRVEHPDPNELRYLGVQGMNIQIPDNMPAK